MKYVNYLSFFLLTLFSISFISCSDDDDNKLNTGITNQSWTEGKSLEISQDNELSVSFNAAAKWVASVTSGADWCKLNTTSGTKGQSTLKLSVSTSSTTDRTARISINIDGYSPASFEVTQKGTSVPQTTEDMEINAKVDEYLREMYLWNDEYKTLKPDFTKNYEAFFYDALGSLTTNTLDKKTYVGSDGKTYYNLFSYIQLLPNISSTRTTKIVNKELAYSFGITGITPISIGTQAENTIYFCLQGVYPDSPASDDERMAKLNNKREDELFAYSSYPNLGTSLSAGSLNLPRVYCLVGNGTASASELVINSLEGIDLDVILIGEKTTGKNVGMEYEEYTVRNNTYRVVPITFQSYNAKGFGEYEKGFEPDILMDETNPYNEQGVFYIHKDYGNNEEPLYAKAIELITGTNPAPQTRSAVVNTLDGKTYKLPAIFRPGHDGMLMPARHAE